MLAKAEVPSGTWPELFAFLQTQSQSAEALNREMAIILLHACSQTILSHMSSQSGAISQFLLQGLQDPEQRIRVQTLRAASAVLTEVDIDVAVIGQLLPAIFAVMQSSLHTQDEDLFVTAFELLDDILDTPSFKGKTDTIVKIVEFCITITGTESTSLRYREKAADILGKVCNYKSKLMVKHNLVEPICQVAMKMLADPSCTTASLEPDEDVMSHVGIGSNLLDAVSCGIPAVHVGAPLLKWVTSEVLGNKTSDPFTKKACVIAMGSISMGCRDMLRDNIEQVVEVAKACIADPNPMVRESALVAASLMTEYLQPEILDHHSTLLPLGIDLLGDASPYVREKAAYMVDSYAENLEGDVLPYAQALMTKLAAIVTTDCGPEGMKSRCVAVQAISSIAVAAKEDFAQFADNSFKLLLPLLGESQDEMVTLRARATDAVGCIVAAVPREHFDPYLAGCMQQVAQGLQLESAELMEYSFGFWSNIAERYPEQMAGALGEVVPRLLGCIDSKEGEMTNISLFGAMPNTAALDEEDSDEHHSDEEDEGPDDEVYQLRVDHRLMLARASAFHCLSVLAKKGDQRFEPFWMEARGRALSKIDHHDTTIRKNALELLGETTLWEFRKNFVDRVVCFPGADTLATSTREALQETLFTYLQVMEHDDNKGVVAQACDGFGEICEVVGSVAVHNHIDATIAMAKKILACKTTCQVHGDDEDEDEDDDDEQDHDQQLIDSACDMIEKIAQAYGPSFRPMFDELLPGLLSYLNPSRPHTDHYMALAALGEICVVLGDKVFGHTENFIQICLKALKSSDSGVRSNACFTLGVVCEGGAQQAVPLFPQALPALGEVITRSGEMEQAVDNAVSAVCRLIKTAPAACFLEQTLPGVLQHVPLKTDFAENENVYGTLIGLLNTSLDACKPHFLQIVTAFTRAVVLDSTEASLKMQLSGALQNLANVPEARAAMKTLPADMQQELQKHVVGGL
eukprot:TRINITY_DN6235_c3_g1_i1.p1 TRINITY_DN6235_c3_g1~~TRINITY_DN6235_c3_g1_i1.p1  ORF type:complete len:1109 (+),score=520.97 TRINITY_DN6235_c3_g1_i1:410-3328(+)